MFSNKITFPNKISSLVGQELKINQINLLDLGTLVDDDDNDELR